MLARIPRKIEVLNTYNTKSVSMDKGSIKIIWVVFDTIFVITDSSFFSWASGELSQVLEVQSRF